MTLVDHLVAAAEKSQQAPLVADPAEQAEREHDLGPEGGAGGGRIVAEGPPEVIARTKVRIAGVDVSPHQLPHTHPPMLRLDGGVTGPLGALAAKGRAGLPSRLAEPASCLRDRCLELGRNLPVATKAVLLAKGVTPNVDITDVGVLGIKVMFVNDPEGNPIEIVELTDPT